MIRKLSDRWFKEDRDKYKGEELKEQKKETDKALRNSSVFSRRLARIIKEDIEATYLTEEDYYDNPAWERNVLAAAAERRALKRVLNLLPIKED